MSEAGSNTPPPGAPKRKPVDLPSDSGEEEGNDDAKQTLSVSSAPTQSPMTTVGAFSAITQMSAVSAALNDPDEDMEMYAGPGRSISAARSAPSHRQDAQSSKLTSARNARVRKQVLAPSSRTGAPSRRVVKSTLPRASGSAGRLVRKRAPRTSESTLPGGGSVNVDKASTNEDSDVEMGD
ncbi:hypothetical protein M231_02748 [Tremella mesenterica]|uniref:Uncharacterized protein n=1 Tax=Tremella mesenterica TaxID=5217 RepID=A0A4Q1BPZ1_TREME|nr:hypothetical protein M231_02748 [Tremella mesenterica]